MAEQMQPLPDVEAIVIGYLNLQADIVASIPKPTDPDNQARVYPAIPDGATFPLLTVTLAPSSVAVSRRLIEGVVDISAWANDPKTDITARAAAHDLGSLANAVLWRAAFCGIHDGLGVVTGVADRVALQWLPDPETNRARFVLQMAVYAHPLKSA